MIVFFFLFYFSFLYTFFFSFPGPGHNLHKMMFVRQGAGYWPLPESFFPDMSLAQLPPRTAHPIIRYSTSDTEGHLLENFPFDKYEIEPCSLTQFLVSHMGTRPNICWYVYMGNSGPTHGAGEPFGYLKLSSTGHAVNMFVFPYNFPRLWPLLEELASQYKMNPPTKWRNEFEQYILTVPPYYIAPLRNALKRFGVTAPLVPDHIDGGLSHTVTTYLKKIKQQAKIENDRIAQQQQQQKTKEASPLQAPPSPVSFPGATPPRSPGPANKASRMKSFHQLLERSGDGSTFGLGMVSASADSVFPDVTPFFDVPETPDAIDGLSYTSSPSFFAPASPSTLSHNITSPTASTGQVPTARLGVVRNPFDVPRGDLLSQIERLRHHVLAKGQRVPASAVAMHLEREEQADIKHNVPIGQMGNYQDQLHKQGALREVDEDRKQRPLFGNPFRIEKGPRNAGAGGDEADEAQDEAAATRGARKRRRSASPGPRNARSRSASPSPSPPASPSASPSTPPSPAHHPPPSSPSRSPTAPPRAKPPARPPPALPTDPETANAEILANISKELKKPGKNYDPIFDMLKHLKGTPENKKAVLQAVIAQAQTYKKTQLVGLLEQF
eukprot:TRINITY_DN11566_c0_g1_i1.p1 TRINITY_DN11566_c0_g1~~TRINITY_DN11566_c0_g1_i1.p1  ORF type:complete len:611 (+),score=160.55 TRINITY_DN11566_c0_g1_i1:850-2682(+)